MKNEIVLRPSYWASVSGGKDSLYMLMLILAHPEKYKLDGVVHFELEVDFPFIKNVIDYMESECKKIGIPFVRIKPKRKWMDIYKEKGFPTRIVPWCRNQYKLDAKHQLERFLKSKGEKLICYIGLCADEEKRFSGFGYEDIYPLVDFGIEEKTILEWAKKQYIFNNYYKTNKRCGCMICPQSSRITMAYTLKYYPEEYHKMIQLMNDTEKEMKNKTGKPFSCMDGKPKYNAEYIDKSIRTKWLSKLEEMENENEYIS